MYHLWGTITIHHLLMSIKDHNLDYALSIISREKVMDRNDAWKKVDVCILSWKFTAISIFSHLELIKVNSAFSHFS